MVERADSPASDRDLKVQLARAQRDQVGVVVALRVKLPARGEQVADLGGVQAALRERQAAQLQVLDADPAHRAQHRERVELL